MDVLRRWDARQDAIPLAELMKTLGYLSIERDDLAGAVAFDDESYSRVSIRKRPHFEALVLCWRSGQFSPIHDHAGSSCAVRVVAGRATETRFARSPCGRLVPVRSILHDAGTVTGARDEGIHQMANLEAPGNRSDHAASSIRPRRPDGGTIRSMRRPSTSPSDRLDLPATHPDDPRRPWPRSPGGADGPETTGEGDMASLTPAEHRPTFAVVGGGFSGAMVAVHLSRLAGLVPMRVVVFEKGERIARGIAYGTRCDHHLLNVPAGLMSALPDEPGHFLDWLKTRDPRAHHGTFAPRPAYGDYLESLLRESSHNSAAQIDLIHDDVTDLFLHEDSARRPPDDGRRRATLGRPRRPRAWPPTTPRSGRN